MKLTNPYLVCYQSINPASTTTINGQHSTYDGALAAAQAFLRAYPTQYYVWIASPKTGVRLKDSPLIEESLDY